MTEQLDDEPVITFYLVGRAKKYETRSLKHETGSRFVRDSVCSRTPGPQPCRPTATSSKGEHMKRLLALVAFTAAAIALPASPAVADAPPGHGLETFTVECAEGAITVVGTPGDSASRWIDGQHMVLLSLTFSTDGVTLFTKTYGQKTGLAANAVSCTVTDPSGTATVVRVPVPKG
jgi:hypothetical protein